MLPSFLVPRNWPVLLVAALCCFSGQPTKAEATRAQTTRAQTTSEADLNQDSWLAPTTDGRGPELPPLDPNLPSPAEFLGYPLGERFTPHHRLVSYLQKLESVSQRVTLRRYGSTYENRPLYLAILSSPENLGRLDSILEDRKRIGDPAPEDLGTLKDRNVPAVVWLGYGVHGNESSSAEAALATAYVLAAAQGEFARQLENTVVLIDPLVNPDGRDRFVHRFQGQRGRVPNPNPGAVEHREPWPGGRGNHYNIDLNRDWSWATQKETQDRLVAFRQWEPQVYVDFHEMGASQSYFFPPPAEPIHPRIGDRALHWLDTFGAGNASFFDRVGWTYYVEEQFDLFYPGYGDSYPTLRGGIGMTYEVGGGGRAGALIDLPNGRQRSLADRVTRHLLASLATVATTSTHSKSLVDDFVSSRRNASTRPAGAYLWPADAPEAEALAETLRRHGIRVGHLERRLQLSVETVRHGTKQKRYFDAGTFAVATNQPLGDLIESLMEREAKMSTKFLEEQRERIDEDLDPEFYDVTAWSLPLAFNLEAWRHEGPLPLSMATPSPIIQDADSLLPSNAVGFLVPPAGIAGFRFATQLSQQQIRYRLATEPFTLGTRGSDPSERPAGSLLVALEDQPLTRLETLATDLARISVETGVTGQAVTSSWTAKGIDLGSGEFVSVVPSRIGVLMGDGISSTSFGALWHLLDRDLEAPHSALDLTRFGSIPLAEFDVLLFPAGSGYSRHLRDQDLEALTAWISDGGVLVTIGGASNWVSSSEILPTDEVDSSDSEEDEEAGPEHYIPGAFVNTQLKTHPLVAGVPQAPAWLFLGTTPVEAQEERSENLVTIRKEAPRVAGFTWPEAERQLGGIPLISHHRVGQGSVISFHQDPAFRLFTRGTMPFLLNALYFGPSL